MRAPQRRTGVSVLARLLAAPQAFDFVQALTILLRWLEEEGVPENQAWRTHLRFENSLKLGFPAGEIEALREAASGEAQGRGFVITPAFMGLLGLHGALPLHYTERIGLWEAAQRDEAPRAFLDILSGRMLALYYEAWRKHRVEHAAAREPDRFMPCLVALAGAPRQADRMAEPEGGLPDATLAYFAGMLQQRPRSAAVLQALLATYFDMPVAIAETVGHWSRLDAHEQSALGAGACLGQNTMLGARSWRPDLRARLRIGPLDRAHFERFLPGGDMAAALARMLALFGVPGIEFEIELVLRAAEIGPCRLDSLAMAPAAVRLGRTSFLVTGSVARDRADMRYLVRPMPALRPGRGAAPR